MLSELALSRIHVRSLLLLTLADDAIAHRPGH